MVLAYLTAAGCCEKISEARRQAVTGINIAGKLIVVFAQVATNVFAFYTIRRFIQCSETY